MQRHVFAAAVAFTCAGSMVAWADGAYVGLIGGDAFVTSPRLAVEDLEPRSADVGGANVSGFVGFDKAVGSAFLGLEARVGHSFGVATDASSNSYSAPTFLDSFTCYCNSSPPAIGIQLPDPFALAGSSVTSTRSSSQVFGDISGRIGIYAFGDWRLYGRVGVGAQAFQVSQTTVTTTQLCHLPKVLSVSTGYQSYNQYFAGCGSISNSVVVLAQSEAASTPYLTLGIGMEKDLGAFFIRAETEFVDYVGAHSGNLLNIKDAYAVRATAGIGYRFGRLF